MLNATKLSYKKAVPMKMVSVDPAAVTAYNYV
jgi:hypothetical protein